MVCTALPEAGSDTFNKDSGELLTLTLFFVCDSAVLFQARFHRNLDLSQRNLTLLPVPQIFGASMICGASDSRWRTQLIGSSGARD